MNGVLSYAWRSMGREWRSGETGVLVLALVVAVAAITSVGFFTDRIEEAMRMQAGEVLAADLRLDSRSPLADGYRERAQGMGLRTSEGTVMTSVVLAGERSALAAVRGMTDGYPLRGRLSLTEELFGERRIAQGLPGPDEAWLAPRLMAQLDLRVGDSVDIGRRSFRVGAILDQVPDQGWRFVDVAPTVLIRREALAGTGLIGPGSRLRYQLLVAGERQPLQEYTRWLEANIGPGEDIDSLEEAQPELQRALDRARAFLGLASLVSVLLAGIAVAMATRRHVQRHLDPVAVMKCMGATQSFVLRSQLIQLLGLGLAAGLVGSAIGYLAHEGLLLLVAELVGRQLPDPSLMPVATGMLTALLVLLGFAAAPMASLHRVPPLRVLRRELGAPGLGAWAVYSLALGAVAALLAWQTRDARLFGLVSAGIAGTVLVLGLAALGLVLGLRPLRHGAGVAWRYGLSNLSRRRGETVVQVLAFGLGLMVLLLLSLVRDDLIQGWRQQLPADAPNQFLINIQDEERAAVEAFFVERGIQVPRMYPIVRGRIIAVNGVDADRFAETVEQGSWFLRREQNLTWAPELQAGNQLLAGSWWDAEAGAVTPQVSLERRRAEQLGLGVGDSFTVDVAGQVIELPITSIREVRWDSFRPNFFMVLPPGSLEGFPATWVTALHVPAERRAVMVELVREFPSVTNIDIDAILEQVRTVTQRASLAVEYVFLFTLFAGITVLLAAVQSTRDQRRQESAMLRTLGARRRTVLGGLATEFGMLGVVSGTLAALSASVVGWVLAREVFQLEYLPDPWLWLTGLIAGASLVIGAGLLATRSVVRVPPARSLREL